MGKPLRWVGVLATAGLMLGGAYGFIASRSIGCVADGILPPNATCFRILGVYLSGTTYYTAAGALVGTGIGLVIGSFIAAPVLLWRRRHPSSAVHPLEIPLVWFGLQLVELLLLVPALLFWVPDPGKWPEAFRWATWVVALIVVTFLNDGIRRRFVPR